MESFLKTYESYPFTLNIIIKTKHDTFKVVLIVKQKIVFFSKVVLSDLGVFADCLLILYRFGQLVISAI